MLEALIAGALLAVAAWLDDHRFQRRVRPDHGRITALERTDFGLTPPMRHAWGQPLGVYRVEVHRGRVYHVYPGGRWVHVSERALAR